MNERYLVTGATGFVGSCLVRKLVQQKKNVSVLVRDKNLNWRLQDIKDSLHIYECGLLDPKLQEYIDKIQPTHIFHLAAYGALTSESNVEMSIDVNIKGTIRLLQAIKKYPFKIFVNTGSSSEYGIKDVPMKENDILAPVNDYGVTKAGATLYCQKEALRGNLPVVTFRLFAVFGPYEDASRFIPYVILNALSNKPMEFSSPNNVRGFIHVDDVVNAYLSSFSVRPGEIYNIGSGVQKTLKDTCDIIFEITKSKSLVGWNKKSQQARQVEPKVWQADITKAGRELHWAPRYSLDEGLKKTVAWFRENKTLYE